MLIRVLGPLCLIEGREAVSIRPPRVRRALARLIVDRGRFVSVDAMCESLWHEHSVPKRPDKAVQDLMHDLRGVVGDRLETRDDGRAYRLQLAPSECDAILLAHEVDDARAALAAGDLARASSLFTQALERFAGDPLEDFEHEHFALAEIRRLEGMRWEAVEGRLTADVALGRGVDLAGLPRMVDAQPSRWRLWAAWMVTLHRDGRQADALAVFQDASKRYSERGLEPPRELRDLDARIASDDPALRAPAASILPKSPWPIPAPLAAVMNVHVVGRSETLDALNAGWAACVDGHSSLAAVTGEEGIGKSTVIAAFARAVSASGGLVLAGCALPSALRSYEPLAGALSPLVHDMFEEVALDPMLAPLMRLTPGRALPSISPGDAEVERLAMFEATTVLLERITQSAPVLLALDDLHFIDASTAVFLAHLVARSQRITRLQIVLGFRDEGVGADHPLQAVLSLLARIPHTRVGLVGLDQASIADLVRLELPNVGDVDTLAHAIAEVADGHPLFVDQILRQVAIDVCLAPGLDPAVLIRSTVPDGVRTLVDRRLAALDSGARQLLAAAAVIGHELPVWLLEAVVPGGRDTVLDALDRASEMAILIAEPSVAGELAFRHGYFQRSIYASIPPARRADLHLRVGQALAGRLPRAPERLIARHLLAAGSLVELAELAEVVCRAALDAARQLDASEARRLLDDAQRRLEHDAGPKSQLLAQVLLARASVERLVGDVEATKTAALKAWFAAHGAGDQATLVAAAIEHATFGGGNRSDDDTSIDLLQRTLQLITTATDRARVLARIAYHHAMWSSGSRFALSIADEALALSEAQDDRSVLALSLWAAAAARQGDARPSERLRLGERVIAVAHELDDDRALANGQRVVALSSLELGNLTGFDKAVAAMTRVATSTRSWIYAADVARWQGLRAMARGDWVLAREAIERQKDCGGSASIYPASYAGQLLLLYRDRGQLDVARTVAERAVGVLSDEPALDAFRCLLAVISSEMGDDGEARSLYSTCFAGNDLVLAPGRTYSTALAVLCELAARFGDAERADVLLDAITPYAGNLLVASWGEACLGAADRYRALALLAKGDHRQALDALLTARALEVRLDFHAHLARTDAWTVHALHRLGEFGAAQASAIVIRQRASELGMPVLVREMAALESLPTMMGDECVANLG